MRIWILVIIILSKNQIYFVAVTNNQGRARKGKGTNKTIIVLCEKHFKARQRKGSATLKISKLAATNGHQKGRFTPSESFSEKAAYYVPVQMRDEIDMQFDHEEDEL